MAITLTRDQRDAIRDALITDLTAAGDVAEAIDHGDYERARQLRREFVDDLRLLDDLGWGAQDPGEQFALTMPRDDLARTMRRLHDLAAGGLSEFVSEPREGEHVAQRHAVVCAASSAILAQTGERSAGATPTDQAEPGRRATTADVAEQD